MKQKDMMLIGVVVVFSAIVSLVVSHFLFSSPAIHDQQAEKVPAITAEFQNPSKQYFNQYAIDPTQLIQIGTDGNANPFNGSNN